MVLALQAPWLPLPSLAPHLMFPVGLEDPGTRDLQAAKMPVRRLWSPLFGLLARLLRKEYPFHRAQPTPFLPDRQSSRRQRVFCVRYILNSFGKE